MESKVTRFFGILVSVLIVLTMLILPGQPAIAVTDGVESTFTLNINIVGSSGRIFKDSDVLPLVASEETANFSGNFTAGASIILKTVGGNQRSIFKGWSGDVISTNEIITLVMDSDKTITATFGTYVWVGTAINGYWWDDLPLVERIAKFEAAIAEIKFNMAGMVAFGYYGSQMFEANMLGQFEGRLKILIAELASVNGSTGEITSINASGIGAGGTISPTGMIAVNTGANQTFSIAANSGYHVTDVLVDDVSQGAIGTYTFTNVVANHTITASFAVDASSGGGGNNGGSSNSGSGGGGGGGGIVITPGYTNLSTYVGNTGILTIDTSAQSDDNKVVLNLSAGTKFMTAGGSRSTAITITPRSNTLAPPAGWAVIGLPYNFAPEGATFDPGATLTMSYAGLDLGTFNENNLALAYWDSQAGQWVKLSSYQVDTDNKTVSAVITHFSTYGILGYPAAPAAFTISNLVVTPTSVEAGKDVTVTISVTNSGELSGVYTAVLMVGGTAEATEDVTVQAGETQQVSFKVKRDRPGIYPLSIGDLRGSFTVLKPAAFTISDLVVSPAKVEAAKDITASFQVLNTGEVTGTYPAALRIGNINEATRDITLAAGENQTVKFIVNRSLPGTYNMTAGELSAQFEITSVDITTVQTQTASASAAGLTTSQSSNLWWWVGAGFVLVVAILLFGIKRSSPYNK